MQAVPVAGQRRGRLFNDQGASKVGEVKAESSQAAADDDGDEDVQMPKPAPKEIHSFFDPKKKRVAREEPVKVDYTQGKTEDEWIEERMELDLIDETPLKRRSAPSEVGTVHTERMAGGGYDHHSEVRRPKKVMGKTNQDHAFDESDEVVGVSSYDAPEDPRTAEIADYMQDTKGLRKRHPNKFQAPSTNAVGEVHIDQKAGVSGFIKKSKKGKEEVASDIADFQNRVLGDQAALPQSKHKRKGQGMPTREVDQGPCPKTFVYPLPSHLWNFDQKQIDQKAAFGVPIEHTDSAWMTDEDGLLRLLLYRLGRGTECKQVKKPQEADLFLVPLFPGSHHNEWMKSCNLLKNTNWHKLLPHLNDHTARRHIFVLPTPDKDGIACAQWWREAGVNYDDSHTSALLTSTLKIIADKPFEMVGQDLSTFKYAEDKKDIIAHDIPRLVVVPPPAAIHWGTNHIQLDQTPWTVQNARPKFASYFAGISGKEHTNSLRAVIRDYCSRHERCDLVVKGQNQGYKKEDAKLDMNGPFQKQILHTKRQSVFCLEPPGALVGRKSIIDSILSGCIPVLFSSKQEELYPWHWGSWREDSRVILDLPDECVDGYKGRQMHMGAYKMAKKAHPERSTTSAPDIELQRECEARGLGPNCGMEEEDDLGCDVIAMLEKIPQERIEEMQEIIAAEAHKLQYSLVEYPDDALDILLRKAYRAAFDNNAESTLYTEDEKGNTIKILRKKPQGAQDPELYT